MQKNTLTKADISQSFADETGTSNKASKALADAMVNLLASVADNPGRVVALKNIVKLSTMEKSERPGRNPKTGEDAVITARRVVRASFSGILVSAIEEANA